MTELPHIRIPLVLQAGSTEIKQNSQRVIAHMQVIYDLRLAYAIQLCQCLYFHSNTVIAQEVIEEIMLQHNTMINHIDVRLTDIRNIIFTK